MVYQDGRSVWATGTNGRTGAILRLQDDGNLVVVAPGNLPVWDRYPDPPPPPGVTATLGSGQRLDPGQRLTSSDGRYVFVNQGDGNIVLSDTRYGKVLWATGTQNRPGAVWVQQGDGNGVVYHNGSPIYSLGHGGATARFSGCRTTQTSSWWHLETCLCGIACRTPSSRLRLVRLRLLPGLPPGCRQVLST